MTFSEGLCLSCGCQHCKNSHHNDHAFLKHHFLRTPQMTLNTEEWHLLVAAWDDCWDKNIIPLWFLPLCAGSLFEERQCEGKRRKHMTKGRHTMMHDDHPHAVFQSLDSVFLHCQPAHTWSAFSINSILNPADWA